MTLDICLYFTILLCILATKREVYIVLHLFTLLAFSLASNGAYTFALIVPVLICHVFIYGVSIYIIFSFLVLYFSRTHNERDGKELELSGIEWHGVEDRRIERSSL
jgi:hypothetical protein